MAEPKLMTKRQYAIHRGVSHTAVNRAVADGRITTVGKRQLINPKLADQEWVINTDLTKPRNSVNGNPGGKSGRAKGVMNFNQARAAHETYKARRAKLEFEQLKGMLVNADDVKRRWFAIARRVRDALMSVPDRVSPVVTGMSDQSEVHRVISAEIRTALEELGSDAD